MQDGDGKFVGLDNFVRYFSRRRSSARCGTASGLPLLSTAIVVPLAFVYAYALTRSAMRGTGFFMALALLPLFAPSLLSAISLIYIFGNQGFLKSWLMGNTIYGPIGIVIAQVFYCFPHALMILATALRACRRPAVRGGSGDGHATLRACSGP